MRHNVSDVYAISKLLIIGIGTGYAKINHIPRAEYVKELKPYRLDSVEPSLLTVPSNAVKKSITSSLFRISVNAAR